MTKISKKQKKNIAYIQAELARLDARLSREVHRWQLAGQDPEDVYRGMYVTDDQAEALLKRPFGRSWGQIVDLDPKDEAGFLEMFEQATEVTKELQRQGIKDLRLMKMAEAFGLDEFDLDTFMICLAPYLDLRYEQIFGYLQDDITKKHPTVNFILNLLCEAGAERFSSLFRFSDNASLIKHRILRFLPDSNGGILNSSLIVDPAIVSWLLGSYQPHNDLVGCLKLTYHLETNRDLLLAGNLDQNLEILTSKLSNPMALVFWGLDDLAQTAAARIAAAKLECPLLTLDLKRVTSQNVPVLEAIRLGLRDARLTDALVCMTNWDVVLDDGAPPPRIMEELNEHPTMMILAGNLHWQPRGIAWKHTLAWLEFPLPVYQQRMSLWAQLLENEPVSKDPNLTLLAGQFQLTSSQIRDAVAWARDRAIQRGKQLSIDDLFDAARAYSNPRLSSLARKITPRYSWKDIVLPEDQLAILGEIVATMRSRPQVLENWGVGAKLASSAGVTILFAGPPGTGKTMAAEIIARELGLDLYKIDLSTVVSKYIGETEKNLERIFNEAQSSNAILFFDEADSLFGKRSEVRDAHDRYANVEVSYLLQRMESYDGMTILATNLRANLDEAFTRRLQFAIDFPFPEEANRLRIWQSLFPPDVPKSGDLKLEMLARRFKLAGGNIRNVLVSAAYMAAADGGKVTMGHLMHGTRRELQKMGRLVDEKDLSI